MNITTAQLDRMIKKRCYYKFSHQDEFRHIYIDSHAFERWRQRVSKTPHNIKELEKTINQLYKHGRISIEANIGEIDGDIVFTYYIINEIDILITTFYGRISNYPALSNWHELRKYNERYRDKLNLSLSEKELSEQSPVLSAENILKAKIDKQKIILEFFQTEDKGMVYVLNFKNEGNLFSVLLETLDVSNYPILEELLSLF